MVSVHIFAYLQGFKFSLYLLVIFKTHLGSKIDLSYVLLCVAPDDSVEKISNSLRVHVVDEFSNYYYVVQDVGPVSTRLD
jgi:hypothetical protein